MPAPSVDLLVGQMIALLPKFRLEDATDPALARDVVSMFPRIVTDNSSEATTTRTHI